MDNAKIQSISVTAAEVASYWDWRSRVYDGACSRHFQWHEVFLAPFGEHEALNLLDMGTGTGFLAIGFAEKGHRVTGVDISPDMVDFARKKAAERKILVNFIQGNAQEPPLFSSCFDGVACRNLLWTLPDPLKALTAWRKLLRPMGRIVIADGIWEPRLYLKKDEPVTVKFTEAYSSIRDQLPFFLGMTADDGADLLERAGFSTISRHDHLFRENPYEGENDFFVLSAVNTSSGI